MALLVSVKQVAGAIVLATMLGAGFFTRPAPGHGSAPPGSARRTTSPDRHHRVKERTSGSASSWPAEVTSELDRIDAMHRAIITGQPIEDWRFETVRASYQGLLKRGGDRADLEEAIRVRLARVTQHEQAARAARRSSRSWPAAIAAIATWSRCAIAWPSKHGAAPALTTRSDSSNRRHARSMVTRSSP